MALEKNRHKTKEQRTQLLEAVRLAKERTGASVRFILRELNVARASYYRYARVPNPKPRKPRTKSPPMTPRERALVRETALSHPATGYKALTFLLQNEQIAGVRAHQVLSYLHEEHLIVRRAAEPSSIELKRPASPVLPNEVWHIDLMYLSLKNRWWYLIDIIDGYSRYLVHWSLSDTLEADAVTLTVLEALERWSPDPRPAMVHDHGSQFVSKEWRTFATHHGLPSIRIRVRHPQSNGKVERLHRTHREEGLLGSSHWDAHQARVEIARWADVYNRHRPHSALCGLPPVVYYLGDPDAALAQRDHFVRAQAQARANYWGHINKAGV